MTQWHAFSDRLQLLYSTQVTQELSLTLLVLARQSQSYSDSGVVWNELVGSVARWYPSISFQDLTLELSSLVHQLCNTGVLASKPL